MSKFSDIKTTDADVKFYVISSTIIVTILILSSALEWYGLFKIAFFAIFVVPLLRATYVSNVSKKKEKEDIQNYHTTEDEEGTVQKVSRILED